MKTINRDNLKIAEYEEMFLPVKNGTPKGIVITGLISDLRADINYIVGNVLCKLVYSRVNNHRVEYKLLEI